MDLKTSIENVKLIAPVYAKRLKKLSIKEVGDLLFHFPSRYEDFSSIKPIRDLEEGMYATVQGRVFRVQERRAYRKKLNITEALIEDETGMVRATWFNQYYLKSHLDTRPKVILSGKIYLNNNGLYFSSPEHEILREDASTGSAQASSTVHTARIIPIYPETKGVSSRWFRYAISRLLPLAKNIKDPLPISLVKAKNLMPLKDALQQIHFPTSLEKMGLAKQRFAFEELFCVQLAALKTKYEMRQEKSPVIKHNLEFIKNFVASLPYTLTNSQKKAAWQIMKDLEQKVPMNRLLEGDVGSGKTIVAAISALNTATNGFQVAFMAPTEILAEQHFKTIGELLSEHKVNIALYTRGHRKVGETETNNITKDKLKQEIAEGNINLVIGTHTLTQEGVNFKKLGLIVIDEQHRFGVKQRATLIKKPLEANISNFVELKTKYIPHLLSMTATPIPRSLALTIYGDLDLSLLREMPKGRKKILTKMVTPEKHKQAYDFIKKELNKGRQAFIVFPLIEASEKLQAKSAKEAYEKLSKGPFSKYKLGLLHGKMKSQEKENVMRDFKNNKIHILVSTSVVEVGIDIPNATIMMVESADRFGLAQLYQFRGRVGRDEYQSYCFLLTESSSPSVLSRLNVLQKAKDGFELAEYDLKFRGSGDMYGVRQSGMPSLAMQSLGDIKLIEEARESATKILEKDLKLEKNLTLKIKVEELQKIMHFE